MPKAQRRQRLSAQLGDGRPVHPIGAGSMRLSPGVYGDVTDDNAAIKDFQTTNVRTRSAAAAAWLPPA